VTFHTVAFEGSIGLVNLLQALRLQRKGFKTTFCSTAGRDAACSALSEARRRAFFRARRTSQSARQFMTEAARSCLPLSRCKCSTVMASLRSFPASGRSARSTCSISSFCTRRDNAFMLHTWTV